MPDPVSAGKLTCQAGQWRWLLCIIPTQGCAGAGPVVSSRSLPPRKELLLPMERDSVHGRTKSWVEKLQPLQGRWGVPAAALQRGARHGKGRPLPSQRQRGQPHSNTLSFLRVLTL